MEFFRKLFRRANKNAGHSALANKLVLLKTKLSYLKQQDKKQVIFGSRQHHYQPGSPLSELALSEFETKHNLQLPEDYRQFLSSVGNGGAGPFYGLLPLSDHDEEGNRINYQHAFPYTRKAPLRMHEAYEGIQQKMEGLGEEEQEELHEVLLEKIVDSVHSGIIYLCHEGCGMYSVLVVKGEEYGHVWYVDLANDAGAFPLTDPHDGSPMCFTRWYEVWLDQAINGLKVDMKGLESFSQFIETSD